MSEDKVAAAIITAAVVEKMTFSQDADIGREASVLFRKIERVVRSVEEKNERIAERRKERRANETGEAPNEKVLVRRSERHKARAEKAATPDA